jgi:type IV pilus assembly protein PilW
MRPVSTMKKSAGFSLVELMISVVLGLLLIAGAAAAYLSSKRSYTEVEAYSTLSENAHFAELIIGDALLHVGFFGEVTAERLETNPDLIDIANGDCDGAAAAYNFGQYIFGATAETEDVIGCIDDAMVGTDVLVIKRAVPRPLSDGDRVDGPRTGTIDTPDGPQAGTTYIMTNNVLGIPFDGSGTQPNILAGGDVPGGVAWPYLFEAYYVRDEDPDDPENTPVLARKVLSWNGAAMDVITEDLVEGVEDMRLRLGFDSNNDSEVDSYVDVADITNPADWAEVGSVEVYLLVRATNPDPEFTDERTYLLGGENTVTPAADEERYPPQYRRLLVNTQASLRNPKLVLRR